MTLITLGKAEEAENIDREKFLQAILTELFIEHPVLAVPDAITDPQPVIVTVLDNVVLTKLLCYHESVPNVYEPYFESRINFDRKGDTNTATAIMRSERWRLGKWRELITEATPLSKTSKASKAFNEELATDDTQDTH